MRHQRLSGHPQRNHRHRAGLGFDPGWRTTGRRSDRSSSRGGRRGASRRAPSNCRPRCRCEGPSAPVTSREWTAHQATPAS
eukprot:7082576-Prymnesium_polylepis.1